MTTQSLHTSCVFCSREIKVGHSAFLNIAENDWYCVECTEHKKYFPYPWICSGNGCNNNLSPHNYQMWETDEYLCTECVNKRMAMGDFYVKKSINMNYAYEPQSDDDPSMAQQYSDKFNAAVEHPTAIESTAFHNQCEDLERLLGCACLQAKQEISTCLLYTSPSPRD